MQRTVFFLAVALAWPLAASVQAAGTQAVKLAELIAQGFRPVARAADQSSLVLRRGGSHYVYDTATQRVLELLELPEGELQSGVLGERVGSTSTGRPPYQTPIERMTRGVPEIDASIRAAGERHALGADPQLTRLETELGALAPGADFERRFAATLRVEARTPDELFEILERVSRTARGRSESVLGECGWSACLSADALSVSGSCGVATVEISSRGALGLSLPAEGAAASITLSPEGITLRHARGHFEREMTGGLEP